MSKTTKLRAPELSPINPFLVSSHIIAYLCSLYRFLALNRNFPQEISLQQNIQKKKNRFLRSQFFFWGGARTSALSLHEHSFSWTSAFLCTNDFDCVYYRFPLLGHLSFPVLTSFLLVAYICVVARGWEMLWDGDKVGAHCSSRISRDGVGSGCLLM
ncbi:hypothetical protein K439DRAFT_488455 [Ramaria rubella]|nr:hypothetical protein K439DRAFT_488455 [Ramaria rubella]